MSNGPATIDATDHQGREGSAMDDKIETTQGGIQPEGLGRKCALIRKGG